MNARNRARRLIEEGEGAGEIEVWVVGDEAGEAGNRLGYQNGAGVGGADFGGIFGVGEKGEVVGAGVFYAGDAGDFQFAIAFDSAAEGGGNLAESHRVQSEFPGYRRSAGGTGHRPIAETGCKLFLQDACR